MTAENTPNGTAPDTIVLVHGLWVTPRSWEHWIEHYENKGYRVLAPAYPGLEVEALNEDPFAYRGVDYPWGRRAPREHRRRAGEPPDHHGPLGGSPLYPDPPRPRLRRGGGGYRLRASRGRQGNSGRTDPLALPGPEEPSQPPQGCWVHQRAVPHGLRQHFEPGGLRRGLRTLPHPRSGQLRVGWAPR